MVDPLIYSFENFVVLEPGKNERFLSLNETIEWLENWLRTMESLPKDLAKYSSINQAAEHLINTACEIEISPGFSLQWFAIRLDPSEA